MAVADLVTGAYDALNRGDVDGALALLAEDAEWEEHSELPEAGTYHGIGEIRTLLESFLESWNDLHQEAEEVRTRRNRVLVFLRLRARGRGSGVAVESRYAHLWTLRQGRAVRVDAYYDPGVAERELEAG